MRTRVGYAGGVMDNPTYHDLGEHSETIQIDYDPEKISYQELVDKFWELHNPHTQPRSRQYYSILFYHNQEQLEIAQKVKGRIEKDSNRKVKTEFMEYKEFHLAEDYHQKFYLQQNSIFKEHFREIYSLEEFIDSTAVARVNGYVARKGDSAQLIGELDKLGLSEEGEEKLLEMYEVQRSARNLQD